MTILIPVLGDQLSHGLATLNDVDKADATVLLMVADETTYVRHHKRKIALILSAMRHFADELRGHGWTVDYVRLDDPTNSGSFMGEGSEQSNATAPPKSASSSRANGACRSARWLQP